MAEKVLTQNNGWRTGLEWGLMGAAIVMGALVATQDFKLALPLLLGAVVFLYVRFALKNSFSVSLAFYFAIAAFNYYYFYCSALTGRNPTDVGEYGVPASAFEKVQRDIVFAFVLLLGGVRLMADYLSGRPVLYKRLSHPLLLFVVLFILFSILRSFFIIFEADSLFNFLFYLRTNVEYALIPLLLCTTLISDERHHQWIFKGMLYTLPIVAGLGVVEFFLQGSPYTKSFMGGQTFYRVTATLQNPNNLGAYLATTLGVFILFYLRRQLGRWEQALFWLSLPLGIICLCMTLSRSSILCFILAMMVSLGLIYYRLRVESQANARLFNRKAVYSLIGIGAVSLFVLFRFFDFKHAFDDGIEMYLYEPSMSSGRLFAMLPALQSIIANPAGALFGYSPKSLFLPVDNGFALALIRNGIVGFFLYISIWLIAGQVCLKRILSRRIVYSPLYHACFFILCFQFLFFFSATMQENFPHNLYFWFSIGVIAWLESATIQRRASAAAGSLNGG